MFAFYWFYWIWYEFKGGKASYYTRGPEYAERAVLYSRDSYEHAVNPAIYKSLLYWYDYKTGQWRSDAPPRYGEG